MIPTTWPFQTAIFLALTGGVLFLIGFGTTHWVGYYFFSIGLWRRCSGYYVCESVGTVYGGWFTAVQALECLALILWCISSVLTFLVFSQKTKRHRKLIKVASSIGMGTSGTLIIIGVVIFGLQTNYNLGYSFWLTTIAGGVALVTAVLLVGDICMKQPETTTRQFQVVYYPTAGTQVVQYPVIYSPINGQTVQYPARGVVLSGQYSSGYSQTLVPMCQNQAAFLQTPTLSHSANNLAAEPPPYSSLSIQNHTTEKKHS